MWSKLYLHFRSRKFLSVFLWLWYGLHWNAMQMFVFAFNFISKLIRDCLALCEVNNNCPVNSICNIEASGFQECICNHGYKISIASDQYYCAPINLCTSSNGGCPNNSTCIYTGPSNITCLCNTGYIQSSDLSCILQGILKRKTDLKILN